MISELKATFTDVSTVSTDPEDLRVHRFSKNDEYPGMFHLHFSLMKLILGVDLINLPLDAPHSVPVFPESTQDAVKITKIATKYRMLVVPYSGATSLERHFQGVSPLSSKIEAFHFVH